MWWLEAKAVSEPVIMILQRYNKSLRLEERTWEGQSKKGPPAANPNE